MKGRTLMYNKKECVAMLLAGGQGSRLYALTKNVAKPAVPYGGKYRIIDFPLSNCVNSGIDTVGVLTQYQPLVLNDYIGNELRQNPRRCSYTPALSVQLRRSVVRGYRKRHLSESFVYRQIRPRVCCNPFGRPYLQDGLFGYAPLPQGKERGLHNSSSQR